MYTSVGTCPTCGAPIWTPTNWMSITPPPIQYSCDCHQSKTHIYTTTGTGTTTGMQGEALKRWKEEHKINE